MSRVVAVLVRFFLRWMPDAFVVAALLTLLTFALAVGVSGYGVGDTLRSWGDGFWGLLTFTNQITLTLLLGYALANTRPVRNALDRLADIALRPLRVEKYARGFTKIAETRGHRNVHVVVITRDHQRHEL